MERVVDGKSSFVLHNLFQTSKTIQIDLGYVLLFFFTIKTIIQNFHLWVVKKIAKMAFCVLYFGKSFKVRHKGGHVNQE